MEATRDQSNAVRQERSRYDEQERRQAVRRGKERGVWVFIPAAELRAAGVDPQDGPPRYRVWGRGRGSVLVRLYKQRSASRSDTLR